MASFVKMEWLDPYELLASRLRLSKKPMSLAFDEAFRAYLTCHPMTINTSSEYKTSLVGFRHGRETNEEENAACPHWKMPELHRDELHTITI